MFELSIGNATVYNAVNMIRTTEVHQVFLNLVKKENYVTIRFKRCSTLWSTPAFQRCATWPGGHDIEDVACGAKLLEQQLLGVPNPNEATIMRTCLGSKVLRAE
jgi:hypothetical protein